jgi:hypothetical protein
MGSASRGSGRPGAWRTSVAARRPPAAARNTPSSSTQRSQRAPKPLVARSVFRSEPTRGPRSRRFLPEQPGGPRGQQTPIVTAGGPRAGASDGGPRTLPPALPRDGRNRSTPAQRPGSRCARPPIDRGARCRSGGTTANRALGLHRRPRPTLARWRPAGSTGPTPAQPARSRRRRQSARWRGPPLDREATSVTAGASLRCRRRPADGAPAAPPRSAPGGARSGAREPGRLAGARAPYGTITPRPWRRPPSRSWMAVLMSSRRYSDACSVTRPWPAITISSASSL